jgi:hypothetical protein
MIPKRTGTLPLEADYRLLASLLEVETINYKRLLRLAWRQNSYMKRQDVDRLEANAGEWARYLPAANESRIAREKFVHGLATQFGTTIPPGSLKDLLAGAGQGTREHVMERMNELKATAVRLARQNDLNRELARFCLELAEEEARIFKDAVLNDPSGCYDGKAQNTNLGAGGILVKQA